MTNRRLRKILKKNELFPNEKNDSDNILRTFFHSRTFGVLSKVAACFVFIAVIGVAWFGIVRFIGPQSQANNNDSSGASIKDSETGVHSGVEYAETKEPESNKTNYDQFKGETVRIAVCIDDFAFDEFNPEKLNGDAISDNAYIRNKTMADTLGIACEIKYFKSAEFKAKTEEASASGNPFDIYIAGTDLIKQLDCSELRGNKYLELDSPAYPDFISDSLSVKYVTGIFSANTSGSIEMLFLNTSRVDKEKTDAIRAAVADGSWNPEKYNELLGGLVLGNAEKFISGKADLYIGNYFGIKDFVNSETPVALTIAPLPSENGINVSIPKSAACFAAAADGNTNAAAACINYIADYMYKKSLDLILAKYCFTDIDCNTFRLIGKSMTE